MKFLIIILLLSFALPLQTVHHLAGKKQVEKTKHHTIFYSDIDNMQKDVNANDSLTTNAYAQFMVTKIHTKLIKNDKGYKWEVTHVEWQTLIALLTKDEFKQENKEPDKYIIRRYLQLRKLGRDVNAAWYYIAGQQDYDAVKHHEEHHIKQYNEAIPEALIKWIDEYNNTSYSYSSEKSAHKYKPDFMPIVVVLNDDKKTKITAFLEPNIDIRIALLKKYKLHQDFEKGHNLEYDAVKSELDFLEKKYGKN